MDDAKLVHMANEIARFFGAYPAAEAAAGISDHIEAFWTPKMRRALAAQIQADQTGADQTGIDPLVVLAFTTARAAESPIVKEIAGTAALGALASDAG